MASELDERFAPHNATLPSDVKAELESILRLHSITPQELFYKWESYSIKMGGEDTKMDLKNARDLKKDLQDSLEREMRAKTHVRAATATPRTVSKSSDGVFGMMDGVIPNTPRLPMRGVNGNSSKRKSQFETPTSKISKMTIEGSPLNTTMAFSDRQGAGQIVESLNQHIHASATASISEPRIKLKANTDFSKFTYKPMAMKLSEASEILDDRIDAFMELVQDHYNLEDGSFGNPANESANEIIAIGRIASDSNEGKFNIASVVLETSRRTGAGLRVPLKLDSISGYELFPGKIVAVRGSNASGEQFVVSEILQLPLLPPAASTISELDSIRGRVGDSLDIIISSGPYTSDNNLDFEPLHELCEQAIKTHTDGLILLGPFLDIEHPLLVSGDFPDLPTINQDTATLTDVFRALISAPLQQMTQKLPTITIIMVPSIRDTINKHVSWPQDRMNRKELGLPKQVAFVTNPVTISLNETVINISTQDVLYELQQEKCTGPNLSPENQNLLARLSRHIIEQRHSFPLFPPTPRGDRSGAMLDISYLALGEWQHVRPDILILPSMLAPFAKVVESVLVINPGSLSKKKGAGTYARMTVEAAKVTEEERQSEAVVAHKLFERSRVDILRI